MNDQVFQPTEKPVAPGPESNQALSPQLSTLMEKSIIKAVNSALDTAKSPVNPAAKDILEDFGIINTNTTSSVSDAANPKQQKSPSLADLLRQYNTYTNRRDINRRDINKGEDEAAIQHTGEIPSEADKKTVGQFTDALETRSWDKVEDIIDGISSRSQFEKKFYPLAKHELESRGLEPRFLIGFKPGKGLEERGNFVITELGKRGFIEHEFPTARLPENENLLTDKKQ